MSSNKIKQVLLGTLVGVGVLACQPSPSPAALSIVQIANGSSSGAVPGNVVFGSTPTVGDLIVIECHPDTAPGTIPTWNTSAYTQLGTAQNTDTNFIGTTILTRYVQNGDTTTLPVMATAGSVAYAYFAWEISGVSGSLSSDLQVVGAASYSANVNPVPYPSQTPQTTGTLALWSGANNFSSSTISVPSGWTADLNTGTEPNWGTLAALHQLNASIGTVINGNPTSPLIGGNGPLILQTSKPAHPWVRQEFSNQFEAHAGNYNTPGFLQTTPIVGNLEIAFVEFVHNPPAAGSLTVGGSWTKFDELDNSGSIEILALERYVQGGDTATLPQFFTTNSSNFFWGYNAYEIAGVAGTWVSDFQSVKNGAVFAGTTTTTTTDTTLQANTLALVGVGTSGWSSSTAATVGSGWAIDGADGRQFAMGSSKTFGSKSSSVSNVLTIPASGNIAWEQVLIGAPPASGLHNLPLLGVGD